MNSDVAHRRPLLTAAIGLAVVSFCTGCPASNVFRGRFVIINNTGGIMTEGELVVGDKRIPIPDLSQEKAWLQDLGNVAIFRTIEVVWTTQDGNELKATIPFRRIVPDQCGDDLIIEIRGSDEIETRLARLVS